MNLATYPQVALILFLIVFVCVVIYVLRVPRKLMQKRSELPLEKE
jgi:cbb3-type cytochrome oxidase subunit 3